MSRFATRFLYTHTMTEIAKSQGFTEPFQAELAAIDKCV